MTTGNNLRPTLNYLRILIPHGLEFNRQFRQMELFSTSSKPEKPEMNPFISGA